ncbi:pyridoxal-phosphate-dependent aminotransferase family protein [Virgibacillus doumboii]|uniref:pyridoxal-phosphate-dependent aminotransferase family protein n=1 Tax=Virgibacillus doumboii TaxID=2697503 RepID=UPI0013E094B3|nr:alanine--glyoxylate aminotransferase family protein [Virgibacillus doumboii]
MLPDQQLLRIPGPTPIPPSVQRAMSQPMIGHRGTETKELLRRVKPRLNPIFGTEQDVLLITGSGTAGLEAAVANTIHPGDEVLVIVTGAFGERFAKICEAYQAKTHRYQVEWGKAVSPAAIEEYFKKYSSIKAVFATFSETSTGVLNPVQALAAVVHKNSDALFIVDGVSSVGGVEVKMDEWSIDILVTGSQKAMMLPPGLTLVALSEHAWQVIDNKKQPPFYLDLKKYRSLDSTPFTPALPLLFGLEKVLELIEDEGLEQVFARHQLLMKMTRAAFRALDIPLLTNDDSASPTVTAVKPDDFDPEKLRSVLKQEFGLETAGGQQHMKGQIFRIGHMGYCSPADILQTISIIEISLRKIGNKVELGKGTRAAQEIYLG